MTTHLHFTSGALCRTMRDGDGLTDLKGVVSCDECLVRRAKIHRAANAIHQVARRIMPESHLTYRQVIEDLYITLGSYAEREYEP